MSARSIFAFCHWHIQTDVCAIDAGEVSVLLLLDPSAAFDTVDHGVLLDILQKRLGGECCALVWFRSYM